MNISRNVSFKVMLREVVGGTIASARTETERIRFYREFLTDVRRGSEFEVRTLIQKENIELTEIEVQAGEIAAQIERERKTGFDAERKGEIRAHFKRWYSRRRSQQGRKAALARFKKRPKKTLGRSKIRPK